MQRIGAEKANAMTEQEILDIIFDAPELERIEINAADPSGLDTDGVYLEVVKLEDAEVVVRDRWPNLDGDRHIVSTSDVYAIYRALMDQVEEVA